MLPKGRFLEILAFFPNEEHRFLHAAKENVKSNEKFQRAFQRRASSGKGSLWGEREVLQFMEEAGLAHLMDLFNVSDVASFIAKFDVNKVRFQTLS